MTPRGILDKNPGNLRYVASIQWQGLADPPQDAEGYCVFTAPIYGLRALAKDLLTKWRRGLNTVRSIIEVYAPPSENDTESYIDDVCAHLAVTADQVIDLTDHGYLYSFVRAICWHENGQIPYDQPTISQAVSMALMP
jgi:hypothetical protein